MTLKRSISIGAIALIIIVLSGYAIPYWTLESSKKVKLIHPEQVKRIDISDSSRSISIVLSKEGIRLAPLNVEADMEMARSVFSVLSSLEIDMPVSKLEQSALLSTLEQDGYHIQVYSRLRWFNRLGPSFLIRSKSLYILRTDDGEGAYAYVEGSPTVYRVYLPSVRGDFTALLEPDADLFRNRTFIDLNFNEIASVRLNYAFNSQAGFTLEQSPEGWQLGRADGQSLGLADSLSVSNYLTSFRALSYDRLMNDKVSEADRLLSFGTDSNRIDLSIYDSHGKMHQMSIYPKYGRLGRQIRIDPNRQWAIIGKDKDTVTIITALFDPILSECQRFMVE